MTTAQNNFVLHVHLNTTSFCPMTLTYRHQMKISILIMAYLYESMKRGTKQTKGNAAARETSSKERIYA
eukprot:2147613-Ditylum_brightwellii.AAC.1